MSVIDLYQTDYDKTACAIGVVHLGYGAFHRAHQAVYFDDYMQKSGDLNWGIAAVNLNPHDSESFNETRDDNDADGYLLKTIAPDASSKYRMVRSHVKYLDWVSQKLEAEYSIALDTVHMVTITVTESGYYIDESGNLDSENPIIADEIKTGKYQSIYGFLANALDNRMQVNILPLSILCCDNIRDNGGMLRRNFLRFLTLAGKDELRKWVIEHISFPSSMVDRITPQTNEKLVEEVKHNFCDKNYYPIHAETFSQWVIENNFASKMPELEQVGVQIVDNIYPYEEAKIRILNGGHSAVAYLAILSGLTTFDEALRHPTLKAHFEGWENEEVLPSLNINLPFDKAEYKKLVTERFLNVAIADSLERICMDGFTKLNIFIKPTIVGCLALGIVPKYGYDVIASFYIFARHVACNKIAVAYRESHWALLEPLLSDGQAQAFANFEQLWEDIPTQYPEFSIGIINAINKLEKQWPV
ncbi:MAG: mannitol dehydrogenase family protein [Alphaproteobacteria bacterium]|nr:mannitol dehydrogenase family protein [Alphaproteobacteria bacterium]